MNHLLAAIFILFFLFSCTTKPTRTPQKPTKTNTHQEKLLKLLSSKPNEYKKCGKHLTFNAPLKSIELVLRVKINHQGKLDSLVVEKYQASNTFYQCVYQIIEGLAFPTQNEVAIYEIEQPLIYTKKAPHE